MKSTEQNAKFDAGNLRKFLVQISRTSFLSVGVTDIRRGAGLPLTGS